MKLQRITFTLLALSTTLLALPACVPLVLGGAFVGTAMVASDRRTSGAQLEDEGIELRGASRIRQAMGERSHVNITSYNRQVLLTGEVPSDKDKAAVLAIVQQVENVKTVLNEVAVLGNSSLSARSSDALITGRAKAALVDDKELFAKAFKLVTERGTVYMMGRVTQREAAKATEIVRGIPGVLKVVRALEIISEEEFQRLQPAPANAK